jgi:hypothetical protein
MHTIMFTNLLTDLGYKVATTTASTDLGDKILNATRYEADVLALWLLGSRQSNLLGDLANLWLCEITYGE